MKAFLSDYNFYACISIRNADIRPAFDIAHPDMDIFINTDKSPAQLQTKATGSPLTALRVKRGAVVPLSITILGAQTATGLRMGIKAKGNYEGELLILAEAESGTQTELGSRFDLKQVASALALDVGEGKESSPATLAAMTEFSRRCPPACRLSSIGWRFTTGLRLRLRPSKLGQRTPKRHLAG